MFYHLVYTYASLNSHTQSIMRQTLQGQTILITGGTGSWGQELTAQLLREHKPKAIRIYSRGEHKQVEMRRTFSDPKIKFYIGDVRDKSRLVLATREVDVVFHLAALKHVPVCEENPWEAVQTNIVGTQNVIEASIANNVKKVVYVSSDKAVDPFNLYGATKSCGEQLIIDANNHHTTRFVCIRAGNVIGTNGSVIPLFRDQALNGTHLTVTDDRMTRFFMRRKDAIGLLIKKRVIRSSVTVSCLPFIACSRKRGITLPLVPMTFPARIQTNRVVW